MGWEDLLLDEETTKPNPELVDAVVAGYERTGVTYRQLVEHVITGVTIAAALRPLLVQIKEELDLREREIARLNTTNQELLLQLEFHERRIEGVVA